MLRVVKRAGFVANRVNCGALASNTAFARVSAKNFSTQMTPFILADIGEGIAEVELMQWFVKEGDKIKAFDRICEVQSDKATVEITSRYDGTVAKVHHKEGDIVNVGSALVDILTSGNVDAPKPKIETTPTKAAASVVSAASASPPKTASITNDLSHNDKVKATPAVRKIAKENDIDLRTVLATGPAGRVLKEDILHHISGAANPRAGHDQSQSFGASHSESTHTSKPTVKYVPHNILQEDRVVPIRGVARLMVKSMQAAQQVQHLTLMEEVVMDNMVTMRSDLKKLAESRGLKLSYMPFIIKAASLALEQYPMLNSTVNSEVTEVVYHASHNIGVAMDTPTGLVVPVIKNVQNKSIFDIAEEMSTLIEKGMTGKLGEADLTGGTFSLTNIGSIGGTYATPVLVVPQVAIGAFGRLQVLPRYVGKSGKAATPSDVANGDATAVPSTVMNISWSADHRVVDGATVARFSNVWKNFIEDPSTMLVSMR
jgi:2-oxoisovalerate dehydrogenase E2 component (dihydrolipoyl transacylase)